jgi:hypothetical protein
LEEEVEVRISIFEVQTFLKERVDDEGFSHG